MQYIDIHAHMVSRVTDDYERMAQCGCVVVSEPAFWAGWDRSNASGFRDYFNQLVGFEKDRAAQYGIKHYTWLAINPKESEDRKLSKEVLAVIPEFLDDPSVLGIGEIGLNKNTKNEYATFVEHIKLAKQHNQLILIHTPHLEDKYKGTLLTLRALEQEQADPHRVLIDHCEEHTISLAHGKGYWVGMTLYPKTKVTPARAVDIIEQYAGERIIVSCACDWGESDPLGVPKLIQEMKRRGHSSAFIKKVVFDNPADFLSGSPHFIRPQYE